MKTIKGILISFFLLFGLIHFTYSNSFVWFDDQLEVFYKIDFGDNKVFYKPLKNDSWKEYGSISIDDLKIDKEDPDRIEFIKGEKFNYLIVDGSGIVYTLSKDLKFLNRFDQTVFRGYNYDSYTFFDGVELMNIGGHHDEIYNSVLTYFDVSKKQWEAYNYTSEYPMSLIEGFIQYYPKSRSIKCLDFLKNQQYPESFNRKSFNAYELNINTFSWKNLGKLNEKVFTKDADYKKWVGNWIDDLVFIRNHEDKYFILDFASNQIFQLKTEFEILEKSIIYKKGTDIVFINFDNNFNLIDEKIIPLNLLLTNGNSIGELLSRPLIEFNEKYLFYSIEFILIVLILIYGYKLYKLKFKKSTNNLKEEVEEMVLSNNLISFFNELKKDLKKDFYTTNELNDIINCSTKAFDTQRQYRSRFISELENYLFNNFGIENGIIRIQDNLDKRCVNYQINPDLLQNEQFKEFLENLE